MFPDGHRRGPETRDAMNQRTNIGVMAAMLAVLCCGGPLFISLALGTAGTAGLLAWLFKSLYFAIPAVFMTLGLVGVWLHRRHSRTSARFDPGSRE
ncbi:MAG: hypothetical protein NVS2B5_29770 [Beijerinckiaceae bacterium]